MKRVFLLRHAKAVVRGATGDFDRVLAPDGHAAMTLIAADLARRGFRPDIAFVSPAARTRETWAATGLSGVPTKFVEAIYDAAPETLLEVLRGAAPEAGSVMLVGHNPGIEEIALALLADRDPELARGMPTAALAVFDVPCETWRDLATGTASLVRYVTPASLRAEAADDA